MKLHPLLSRLAHVAKKNYYVEMKHANVLSISCDEKEMPILFCIVEEAFPDTIILCFNLEPMSGFVASDLTYMAMTISPTALGEEFFIDDLGVMRWGEAAFQNFMTNAQLDISTLTPPSDLKN